MLKEDAKVRAQSKGQRICPVGRSMLIKNKVLPVCT